jgi:GDP-4-dehydro-6-deoxy-D-mannose reductase
MNILITGISGFAGRHLAWHILNEARKFREKKCSIYGFDLNLPAIDMHGQIEYCQGSITVQSDIDKAVSKAKPDVVFNLAGMAFVPDAEKNPINAMQINALGVVNLFQSLLKVKRDAKIILISSSEVYGEVDESKQPIAETVFANPSNIYGISKLTMERFADYYIKTYEMNASILRPFNHVGPGQSDRFVLSSFAKQIADIEKGLSRPVLYVGNLSPYRDFTDVRDIARAYWLSALQGKSGEIYNICSGQKLSVRHVVDELIRQAKVHIDIEVDSERYRESDTPLFIGSSEKFKNETGWIPEFSMEDTVKSVLDYWRY